MHREVNWVALTLARLVEGLRYGGIGCQSSILAGMPLTTGVMRPTRRLPSFVAYLAGLSEAAFWPDGGCHSLASMGPASTRGAVRSNRRTVEVISGGHRAPVRYTRPQWVSYQLPQ